MKTILILLFSFLFIHCNNDDDTPVNPIDQLPPPTQTGENTFGCLVNGEPLSITNSYRITAIYQQGQLQFGGGAVYILINDPFEINIPYELINIDEGTMVRFIEANDGLAMCYYDFEDTYEGYVKFTNIDRENYIISGNFEFSTAKENCDSLIVTNGRFDMHYIP